MPLSRLQTQISSTRSSLVIQTQDVSILFSFNFHFTREYFIGISFYFLSSYYSDDSLIRAPKVQKSRWQNVILHWWEGNFILFDKIPVSTIKLSQRRFQSFLDVSLFEKLIWMSRRLQNKTVIRGASPGISYELREKDAIGGQSWNIATQDRNINNSKTVAW